MKTRQRYKLIRFCESDNCTIGKILFGDKTIYTLELPWRDNKWKKSRIKPAVYLARLRKPSRKFKYPHFHLIRRLVNWIFKPFIDRTWILIHRGNWPKNTTGCILVGLFIRDNMNAVYKSKDALDWMVENLPDKWELEIVEEF